MANFNTISVHELAKLKEKGELDVVDVRTPAEFREVHAVVARNVPLDTFEPEQVMRGRNGTSDQPLYVMCRSGNRSHKACEKLIKAGFTNIVNVEGGTQAWEQAGHPVRRGKKTISLERQVRIAAGSLVLLGSVLGLTVHPYFAGLAAFVGAGLIFAGVTDTCGMAMLLAKMPWNRVGGDGEQCTAG